MHVVFQSSFRSEKTSQITSQGSPKEYIGHNKGEKILDSPWKKCIYFCKKCTYFS